jgi:hypothetical protein
MAIAQAVSDSSPAQAMPEADATDSDVVAYSPADHEPNTATAPAHVADKTIDRPPVGEPFGSPEDAYADQTATSRKFLLPAELSLDHAPSSPRILPFIDEASADNPYKTVRPPEIVVDVEVDFEPDAEAPTTSRESELNDVVRELRAARGGHRSSNEDEETETMHLTPELRARIEQMTRSPSAGETSPPPPTRREKS